LREAGLAERAWLCGERADVPDILRSLDLFVLPSLAEGISNTILEAMATGLPVVATRVGGNAELVDDGRTGTLVPAADADAMASAMVDYAADAGRARAHGLAGRERALARFSLERMVQDYEALYDRLCAPRAAPVATALNAHTR
jgi:glycosyltransferase involved in cell wall biosynthesis